jgi:hypothetical protein
MPIDYILALLVSEKDKLTRAIEALEDPAARTSFERAPEEAATPLGRAKRKLSAAGQRAIVAAAKARWAAIKAAKAAAAPAADAATPKVTPTKAKTVKKKASSAKSAAFGEKMSERMKAAWAARKKKAAGKAKTKG